MSVKMVQLGQGRKQRNAASSVRTSGCGRSWRTHGVYLKESLTASSPA
jgi:hypothetical protein